MVEQILVSPAAIADQLFLTVPAGQTNTPTAPADYIRLFWRPYLGPAAFCLWDVLQSLTWYVPTADPATKKGHKKRAGQWPSIDAIASLMGPGYDRHTILGRRPTKARPRLDGCLDVLEREHLVNAWNEGRGAHKRYFFQVRRVLPILTPTQAGRLDAQALALHGRYLDATGIISSSAWAQIRHETLIPRLYVLE